MKIGAMTCSSVRFDLHSKLTHSLVTARFMVPDLVGGDVAFVADGPGCFAGVDSLVADGNGERLADSAAAIVTKSSSCFSGSAGFSIELLASFAIVGFVTRPNQWHICQQTNGRAQIFYFNY